MKGYKRFQDLLSMGYQPAMMKFGNVKAGKINRIAARVSFALAFNTVQVEGYTEETIQGYNGLFKTFLAFSALEGVLDILGYKTQDLTSFSNTTKFKKVGEKILELDKKSKIVDFLLENTTHSKLKERLSNFIANKENPLILAAAVRHTFAHGKLTANVNQANPKAVAQIGNLLSDLIFNVIDTEFENKINLFYERAERNDFRPYSEFDKRQATN